MKRAEIIASRLVLYGVSTSVDGDFRARFRDIKRPKRTYTIWWDGEVQKYETNRPEFPPPPKAFAKVMAMMLWPQYEVTMTWYDETK